MLLIVGDLALTLLALWLAHLAVSIAQGPGGPGASHTLDLPFALLVGAIWLLILISFALYDTRNISRPGDELRRVAQAVVVAAVLLAGVLYMLGHDLPRIVLVYFFALDLLLVVGYRVAVRLALRL